MCDANVERTVIILASVWGICHWLPGGNPLVTIQGNLRINKLPCLQVSLLYTELVSMAVKLLTCVRDASDYSIDQAIGDPVIFMFYLVSPDEFWDSTASIRTHSSTLSSFFLIEGCVTIAVDTALLTRSSEKN